LFKYPTRQRPEWFRQTLAAYYSRLSGVHEYRFVITMDIDDDTMIFNQGMGAFLSSHQNLSWHYGNHKSKIEACNAGVPDEDWDILVLVSDDMTPIVTCFDDIIARDMQQHFPQFDGVLHYNDGKVGNKLMTLSVLGREFYKKVGFVYWPAYRGTWCDNDTMETAQQWGKYWYSDQTIIRHDWQQHEKYKGDAVYQKGESSYPADKLIYEWRKGRKFPVSFSQNDEDWPIRRYFKDNFHGRFLDIGAGDGVTFSNTKILYDMGWDGVAMEPSPSLLGALELNMHPGRVKTIRGALATHGGGIDFYHARGDFISTTNTAHRDKWATCAHVPYETLSVTALTWDDILAQHGYDFDFLNLDVEGENIALFKLIPAELLNRLKMVCVEYDGNPGAVNEICQPYGFRQIHSTSENVILAR